MRRIQEDNTDEVSTITLQMILKPITKEHFLVVAVNS